MLTNPMASGGGAFAHRLRAMRRLVTSAGLLAMLAFAAPAHAGDVTLWACHGPAGGALGAAPIQTTGTVSGNCDAPATALRADQLQVQVPAATTLSSVRL